MVDLIVLIKLVWATTESNLQSITVTPLDGHHHLPVRRPQHFTTRAMAVVEILTSLSIMAASDPNTMLELPEIAYSRTRLGVIKEAH